MAIKFRCECGKRYSAKDEAAGKSMVCVKCRRETFVPLTSVNQWVKPPQNQDGGASAQDYVELEPVAPPQTTPPPVPCTEPTPPSLKREAWLWAIGIIAVAGGLIIGSAVLATRLSPKQPTELERTRAELTLNLWVISDCKDEKDVAQICDDAAQKMGEIPDRVLVAVGRTAIELQRRAPGRKVPLRRLAKWLADLTSWGFDYPKAERTIVGLLEKPLFEQPDAEYQKWALLAVVRVAGTEYEASGESIHRIAQQFESEGLQFRPGLTSGETYDIQVRQDDVAAHVLRPLGVPVRSPWRPESQQP